MIGLEARGVHAHTQVESQSISGLDLTPLIDIIFIVLVFLLLTANAQLLSLPVDVPTEAKSALSPIPQEQNIAINIMESQPHWAIDGKPYQSVTEFEAAFMAAFNKKPTSKVVVAADKNAPVQPLMTVLALLQRQQISQTQILMQP